jgi:hypothetical protein
LPAISFKEPLRIYPQGLSYVRTTAVWAIGVSGSPGWGRRGLAGVPAWATPAELEVNPTPYHWQPVSSVNYR